MAESGRKRRTFPDAFKRETVAAARGGGPVSAVAAELGLPDRLVRAWLRWAGVRHGSMRQPAAVGVTATGDWIHGPEPERESRGGGAARGVRWHRRPLGRGACHTVSG